MIVEAEASLIFASLIVTDLSILLLDKSINKNNVFREKTDIPHINTPPTVRSHAENVSIS